MANPLGVWLRRAEPYVLSSIMIRMAIQPFLHVCLFRAGTEHATQGSSLGVLFPNEVLSHSLSFFPL